MRALLDINFIIALFDETHVFHAKAHTWWMEHCVHGWASCPLTENGVVRIMARPISMVRKPATPADILAMLRRFIQENDHEFWPDNISLRQETVFNFDRIHGTRQLTDIYLLALAQRHKGRLVTFDSKIPLNAISAATPEHLHIVT
jgi:uncharacterized protein